MMITGVLDLRPFLSTRVEDFINDFVHGESGGTWYCSIDLWEKHSVEWDAKRTRVISFTPIAFEVDTFLSAFRHAHRAMLFEANRVMEDSYAAFREGRAYDAYQRWERASSATNLAQHFEHEWMKRELFASVLGSRHVGPVQRFSRFWMRTFPLPTPLVPNISDIKVPNIVRNVNVREMPIHKYALTVRELLPRDLSYGRDGEYTTGEYRILLRPEGNHYPIPSWVSDALHGAFAQAAYPGTRKPRW